MYNNIFYKGEKNEKEADFYSLNDSYNGMLPCTYSKC